MGPRLGCSTLYFKIENMRARARSRARVLYDQQYGGCRNIRAAAVLVLAIRDYKVDVDPSKI